MYDDSGRPPIGSSKLLLVFLVAIIVVMVGTIVLNGGLSTPEPEVESSNNSSVEVEAPTVQYKMVGNNSYGTVTKISGCGNPSANIKVALIVGVDQKQKSANAVIPTLQNEDMLNYCYDIYIINTTSLSKTNGDANNESNLTENEMSESLASEFAVPDIINNNYNFTVDIHSTNDSNSYVFVPSENTYTSKIVAESISNSTNVGQYTPDKHAYTEAISEQIIKYEIPSIVYVTKEYYAGNTSSEISSVIHALDNFDFVQLFSPSANVSETESSNVSSSNNVENNTVIVSSNSSGNKEVN